MKKKMKFIALPESAKIALQFVQHKCNPVNQVKYLKNGWSRSHGRNTVVKIYSML